MDLRELRVVVAISEQGSVTRAAAVLHQSASSVSHALAGLERDLGVELFFRLPRGMAPTDAGEALVAAARRALHEAEVARAEVDAVRGLVTGRLTVAAVRAFTVPLADLLAAFAARHPRVLVRVLPPDSDVGVADLVRSGACEAGFTRRGRATADLDVTDVTDERTVLVVPAGHRLAARDSVRLEELAGERVVAPLTTSAMRPAVDTLFRRHGVEPDVVAEAATNEMVLELVRAGVGCTISTASSVAAVAGRGAVAVEVEEQPRAGVVLVTRRGRRPTPAARALRDLAAQGLAPA